MVCCATWADVRVWKSKSGNHEIKAELLAVNDDSITLLAEDGRELNVPLSKLSAADQEYAANWSSSPAVDAEAAIKRMVLQFYQRLRGDRDQIRTLLTSEGQAAFDAKRDNFTLPPPADRGERPRVTGVQIDKDTGAATAEYRVRVQGKSRSMQMLFSSQAGDWRVSGLVGQDDDGTTRQLDFAVGKLANPAPAPTATLTAGEIQTRGAAAFAKGMCVKCHGDNGQGGKRGPDLTDDQWLHCDGSVAGIRQVLVTGVPKAELSNQSLPFGMNPVTNLIAESELDALAAYVHQLSSATDAESL